MADLKDKLKIRLHVYDIDMAVTIDRQDEELYRRAAALITEVIGMYTDHYQGLKSDKEIHYMALVDISLRLMREQKKNDVQPMLDILEALNKEVEEVLLEP